MIGTIRPPLVVIGATGVVGRGVVEAALAAGWPVLAMARRAEELAQLRQAYAAEDLTVLTGSVTDDEDAERLAAQVRALGRPIGGVVVAISDCANRGRLLDQSSQALRCRLDTDLFPQLAAARAFLPLLARANRGGSYVLVGGPGSDRPWAGYGHRSVAAAALRMLASVLHDEARPLGVRLQLLSVDAPVRVEGRQACVQWPTAQEIGRQAVALLDAAATRGPTRAVVPFVPAKACAGGTPARSPRGARPDGLLTQRWLQDTRTLLARITSGAGASHAAPTEPAPQADAAAHSEPSTPFPSDPHKEASP